MKSFNLTGMKFGRLTVIEPGEKKGKCTTWSCQCDCGKTITVRTETLRNNDTKSCGCYRKEVHTTHNHTSNSIVSPTYSSWSRMISRCTNPNETGYENYGGRGIKVCDRWRSSFENFLTDMGERPSIKYSIERNDVNGDYEPGNCRWATRTEQNINQRIRKDNSTGHKGVHYDKRRKNWYVRIGVHNKDFHIGTYNSIGEAIEARREAENRYFRTNNIQTTD